MSIKVFEGMMEQVRQGKRSLNRNMKENLEDDSGLGVSTVIQN